MKTVHPFKTGKAYLFRSVTNYVLGRVEATDGSFITLSDASWIPSTGRFNEALTGGELDEVEPYPTDCILNIESVVDAAEWVFPLPRAAV